MSVEMTPAPADRKIEWEPQRRMTLDAARRRTGLVKILRLTFILLAVLIVGVVVAYIIVSAQKPAPPPQPAEPVEEIKNDEVRMIRPTFTGRDDAGRPYVVVAESAIQRPDAEDVTDLVMPQLDTDPERDDNNRVTAERGVYDAKNKILDLYQEVTLETPNGYSYKTSHARFLISEDRIIGSEKVFGEGPMGSITADGFEIANAEQKVYFRGNVENRIINVKNITGE